MTIKQAFHICRNLDSPDYTEDEKAYAIFIMMLKQEHNTLELKKAELVKVVSYLFYKLYEVKSAEPAEEDPDERPPYMGEPHFR